MYFAPRNLVHRNAHITLGKLRNLNPRIRIVERHLGGMRPVVAGIIHTRKRLKIVLAAPLVGAALAHRHRGCRTQHTQQNFLIARGKHGTNRLPGHKDRNLRILCHQCDSGALIQQPAVARIQVAAAGNDDRIHRLNTLYKIADLLRRRAKIGQIRHNAAHKKLFEAFQRDLTLGRRPREQQKRHIFVCRRTPGPQITLALIGVAGC